MVARRLLSALVIALLISGASTLLIARSLAKHRAGALSLRYVAAARDMNAGEVLKAEDLTWVKWPVNAAVAGSVSGMADAIGRAVLSPVAGGQPILARQLSALGGLGLSAKIPNGMRAISLKSDQVVGVAGFLLPGTHTDVLVTYRNPLSTEAVTATVLQNAELIAAGQKTEPDPEGRPSTVDVVTLLVTPQDAERVVLASTQGSLHFVLRNGADQHEAAPAPVNVAALGLAPQLPAASATASFPSPVAKKASRGATKAPHPGPARAATPSTYSVIVVRGDKQTVDTF